MLGSEFHGARQQYRVLARVAALDWLVARYFFFYAREDSARAVSLEQALEKESPLFAWHYAAVRATYLAGTK